MGTESTPFITNAEIARVLFQTASLLETMECNPFRVRAYRRAALSVLFLSTPLVEYISRGDELPLPGVGSRMRSHLMELVNTGRFDRHQALLDEVGEPLASLLSVVGVGPRTAIQLVAELELQSVPDLVAAARAGKVRALRGFGPKREANLLQHAEQLLSSVA